MARLFLVPNYGLLKLAPESLGGAPSRAESRPNPHFSWQIALLVHLLGFNKRSSPYPTMWTREIHTQSIKDSCGLRQLPPQNLSGRNPDAVYLGKT